MRILAGVGIMFALSAAPARADSVDADSRVVDAGAIDAQAPPAEVAPASPPLAAAPTPSVLPPAAPPSTAPPVEPLDWPGDEEAKTDFQQSRPVPDLSPVRRAGRYGSVELYGFGELDVIHDSTRSFGGGASNLTLAHPQTSRGDDDQWLATACDSRVGIRASTSEARSVRGLFLVEVGPALASSGPTAEACRYLRLRHAYVAMRSPIVDVLVGRTWGLFGWGGKGFLPNTAALVAPPGQLSHLEPQLRVSHIFRWTPVDFEIAGAFAASPQQGSRIPEGQVGLRFAVNGWRGAAAQGGGPPTASPLQLGVSWARRAFSVNAFLAMPGTDQVEARGDAAALDLFLPVIPARGDDLGNALSLTFEASSGSGFADWYPGLTGGVTFPALPNPSNDPAAVYTANIDPGIVGFDANSNLIPVEWHARIVGAQYHAPFARGRRLWVSATYSRTDSDNARQVTPFTAWSAVWAHARYADANVFLAVTSALQLSLSYEVTRQSFLFPASARNARGLLGATFFF